MSPFVVQGIPMDEYGRPSTKSADLRTKVLHGLDRGTLHVFAGGRPCSQGGCPKDGLLVGDDPGMTMRGTPLCPEHYYERHGHRRPDYLLDDSRRYKNRSGEDYEPYDRLPLTYGEYGNVNRISTEVTPWDHPTRMQGFAERQVPSRMLHGSTQPLEKGTILIPGRSPSRMGDLLRSQRRGLNTVSTTLQPSVAMAFAMNKGGNSRGDGGYATVVQVARLDPGDKTSNPGQSVGFNGFELVGGAKVTRVLARVRRAALGEAEAQEELQKQMGRSGWLNHGMAEGR